jgi:hypothetical protein
MKERSCRLLLRFGFESVPVAGPTWDFDQSERMDVHPRSSSMTFICRSILQHLSLGLRSPSLHGANDGAYGTPRRGFLPSYDCVVMHTLQPTPRLLRPDGLIGLLLQIDTRYIPCFSAMAQECDLQVNRAGLFSVIGSGFAPLAGGVELFPNS